jgi:hypothetical protein
MPEVPLSVVENDLDAVLSEAPAASSAKRDPFARPDPDEPFFYPGLVDSSEVSGSVAPSKLKQLMASGLKDGLSLLEGDALVCVAEALADKSMKIRERVQLAQWIIEHKIGKAQQSIDVKHSSLSDYLELAKQMRETGEILDVSPGPQAQLTPHPSASGRVELAQPERIDDASAWAASLLK